jgi:hypothetical protein
MGFRPVMHIAYTSAGVSIQSKEEAVRTPYRESCWIIVLAKARGEDTAMEVGCN